MNNSGNTIEELEEIDKEEQKKDRKG